MKKKELCETLGFRREVHENCVLLGYYAVNRWQFLTDVSEQPIGPIFRGHEYKRIHYTERLTFYVIYPSMNTSLKKATTGGRNM